MSVNTSIKCHVNSCQHHCGAQEYCSLNTITVGTHETRPKMDQCTDCQSFELK